MAGFVITLARGLVLAVVAVSAIVSMYEATNAIAVYSEHTVFVAGLMMVSVAVLVNPLFCFIAIYGLVRYENIGLALALTLTLPACIAWCVAVARGLLAATSR